MTELASSWYSFGHHTPYVWAGVGIFVLALVYLSLDSWLRLYKWRQRARKMLGTAAVHHSDQGV